MEKLRKITVTKRRVIASPTPKSEIISNLNQRELISIPKSEKPMMKKLKIESFGHRNEESKRNQRKNNQSLEIAYGYEEDSLDPAVLNKERTV